MKTKWIVCCCVVVLVGFVWLLIGPFALPERLRLFRLGFYWTEKENDKALVLIDEMCQDKKVLDLAISSFEPMSGYERELLTKSPHRQYVISGLTRVAENDPNRLRRMEAFSILLEISNEYEYAEGLFLQVSPSGPPAIEIYRRALCRYLNPDVINEVDIPASKMIEMKKDKLRDNFTPIESP